MAGFDDPRDSLTIAYYLHYFSRKPPDLNRENPKLLLSNYEDNPTEDSGKSRLRPYQALYINYKEKR